MRTVMLAALGCNLAWGLVDAVMYVVRTMTERARNRALAKRIVGADAADARRLIADALPPHLATMVGADELEGMRRRLLAAADLSGRPAARVPRLPRGRRRVRRGRARHVSRGRAVHADERPWRRHSACRKVSRS